MSLVMSRRLHGCLLIIASSLVPNVVHNAMKQLQKCQAKQIFYYNQHMMSLSPLSSNNVVRYQKSLAWKATVIV